MTKYRIDMIYPDGTREEDDEIFDDRESAEEHGAYMCSCYSLGGEILNMSNPGDYPLDDDDDADFEVIEIG